MSGYWVLMAFAAVSIFSVYCNTDPGVQDEKSRNWNDGIDFIHGFKPCIDETCRDYHIYGPSDLEPKDPEAMKDELPRTLCILLRPSAVNRFTEIEAMHPGIFDIKYRVLEELIQYMHRFGSLELHNCQPEMKLIELVILAANSLKTEYSLQGCPECIYKTTEDDAGKPVPSGEVTEVPCDAESSGYVAGTSPVCPKSTMKPETTPPKPTEKPYEPSSTQPIADKPYVPSSTEKPYEPSSTQLVTDKSSVPSSTAWPIVVTTKKPCPDGLTTEKPCQTSTTEEYSGTEETEIIAEESSEQIVPQVGSLRGIPGVHYPNYTDIPITSFSCADKKFIPGFYADLDTACQVFHVCYEHRRESFLCPVGTIFNQPILACDYWYSSNCSLAPNYYDVNEKPELVEESIDEEVEEFLTLIEKPQDELSVKDNFNKIADLFPIKVIVTDTKPQVVVPIESTTPYTEVPSEIVDNIVTAATKIISKTRHVIKEIPEPVVLQPVLKPVGKDFIPVFKKPMKMTDLLKQAVVPLVKAKLAGISKATALKTAIPVAGLAKASITVPAAKVAIAAPLIAKASVIPAVKAAAAIPVLAKAKVAVAAPVIAKPKVAAKVIAAAPVIAKGKVAVPAFKVAASKLAVKSSIPALKSKIAVPLVKTKVVPLMKAKVAKSAGTPLLKSKMIALPLAKSKLAGSLPLAKGKLAKAVAISPLTKKALALGYMKLLKAKKVALMG